MRETRKPVHVRLSAAGLTQLDALAEAEQRDRSAMIRVLLTEALAARARKVSR